jgi:hypothetical protein
VHVQGVFRTGAHGAHDPRHLRIAVTCKGELICESTTVEVTLL